jgi:hypothetical protein
MCWNTLIELAAQLELLLPHIYWFIDSGILALEMIFRYQAKLDLKRSIADASSLQLV